MPASRRQHASIPGGGLGGGGRPPGWTAGMPVCQHAPPGGLRDREEISGRTARMPVCQYASISGEEASGEEEDSSDGRPACQYASMPACQEGVSEKEEDPPDGLPACQYASMPASPRGVSPDRLPVCQHAGMPASPREAVRADGRAAGGAEVVLPEAWRRNGLGEAGWRIEVFRRGRYWMWRRGHGNKRESRYGGRFALLPPERQAAYFENVRRRNAHAGDGAGDFPAGRAGGAAGGS
jgi:hypothetical protein